VHALIAALRSRQPVDRPRWHRLWDDLRAGAPTRDDAVTLLTSLAAEPPDEETTAELLRSLNERRPAVTARFTDAVNIVGTGGGPRTFNISTAAAFVAAAAGVRVIKTGGRAHTSRHGSIDLLERLGVRFTSSYEETAETLDDLGVAFPGRFVYPREISLLARTIFPVAMREVGRFVNMLGPFLAAVPISAQLTGVSDHTLLPTFTHLTETVVPHRVWLCANTLGADELTGFADDVIYHGRGSTPTRPPAPEFSSHQGSLADLRPVVDDADLVGHFLAVLAGQAGEQATRTVCLNAAAMRMVLDPGHDWDRALDLAYEAVRSGAAVDLAERTRAHGACPRRVSTRPPEFDGRAFV
jgi:anthranilate phosphoribosyltransferase